MIPGEPMERKLFPGQCVTVPNNGASVAEAFYQPRPFTCSHDVNPLYLQGQRSVVLAPSLGPLLVEFWRERLFDNDWRINGLFASVVGAERNRRIVRKRMACAAGRESQ